MGPIEELQNGPTASTLNCPIVTRGCHRDYAQDEPFPPNRNRGWRARFADAAGKLRELWPAG